MKDLHINVTSYKIIYKWKLVNDRYPGNNYCLNPKHIMIADLTLRDVDESLNYVKSAATDVQNKIIQPENKAMYGGKIQI